MNEVLIVGGGIGGLTLALMLHEQGIPCRVLEAAPEIKPLGVGVNLLPHAMQALTGLKLQPALAGAAVETRELCFYNRHGQFIYKEPRGRFAGYEWPQLSIHRGDLHAILIDETRNRIGPDLLLAGRKCLAVEQDGNGVTAHTADARTGKPSDSYSGAVAVGCDGFHSTLRRQLYPKEGRPHYGGINMWRGVTWTKPFLTGASMVLAGALRTGKMVVYPIRNRLDDKGRQLINWVAEIEQPKHGANDWNKQGKLADFFPAFKNWTFDWLDIAALLKGAEIVLEYPMVDRDPVARWSFGRITLLGDAAHPMYPRGSNGAGQAILDARALIRTLKAHADPAAALKAYEAERLPATSKVVLANRVSPPDAILGEVDRRTGGKAFARIEDVISQEEMAAMSEGYKQVAGFGKSQLAKKN